MMESGKQIRGNTWASLFEALVTSLLAATLILGVLVISAWNDFRRFDRVCPRQFETRGSLRKLDSMIRSIAEEKGKPITTLTLSETNISPEVFPNKDDRFIDAWGHELQYRLKPDETFELTSLGRDGKPGGVGLDADLFPDHREQGLAWPTLMQFYFPGDPAEINRGGFIVGAAITTLMAFVAVFSSIRRSTNRYQRSLFSIGVILRTAGVVVLAIVVGIILMPVHIPNGH